MKEFKYTIDGKEYHVAIGGVSDDYVADVTVNGETFQVQMEKPEEPEKKKVELGKPVEEASDDAAPLPRSMRPTPSRHRCPARSPVSRWPWARR